MKPLMALLAGVAMAVAGAGAQSPPEPAIVVLLTAYEAGHTDAAIAAAVRNGNLHAVFKEMRQHAPRWMSQGAAADPDRRRRLAALFALETAHAALPSRTTWSDARPLVEWGCVQVRHGHPDEFERLWLMASLALLQGADDYAFQVGRQGSDPYYPAGHIAHATRRFPDESRFRLAPILAETPGRFLANRPRQLLPSLAPSGRNSLDVERTARRLIAELVAAERIPAISLEARIRRGILLFNLGDLDGALAALEPASIAGAEPFLAHVAHLVAGLGLESLARPLDAQLRYAAAVDLFPDALSASLLLGSALHVGGRGGEAESLIDNALKAPAQTDPWREFRFGDFRKWESHLAQLREKVFQ